MKRRFLFWNGFILFWLVDGEVVGQASAVLVFVVVFDVVVAAAFAAVGVGEGKVLEVVEVGLEGRFAGTLLAHIGKREVSGLVALLGHLSHRVTFGLGLVGLEVVLEFDVGVQGVVFRTSYLVVVVDIERDVHTPFVGEELTHLEV